MKQKELEKILVLHRKWLNGDRDGKNANLRFADLSSANLRSANLRSADLQYTRNGKKYVSVSCIGSRKAMTTYCVEKDKIWCGCWAGTLAEFEIQVKMYHKNNPQYLSEYLNAIAYFKGFKDKEKK